MSDPTLSTNHVIKIQDWATGNFITLGEGAYCTVRLEGFGSPDFRSDEFEVPGGDGVMFGREYLGARRWTISGTIKSGVKTVPTTPDGAWSEISTLLRAWDYAVARMTPREVMPLYWKRPGRESVLMYGRPERLDPEMSGAFHGLITYTAVFRQSDPKFYGLDEYVTGLGMDTSTTGGIILSQSGMTSPFGTSAYTQRPGSLFLGGDVESPPIITINGPVTNPTVTLLHQLGGTRWSFTLNTTIGSGASVTIDTRHWKRSIVRNDGVNLAGTLNGSRLALLMVQPGNNNFSFTGSNTSGSTSLQVRVRNAWASV